MSVGDAIRQADLNYISLWRFFTVLEYSLSGTVDYGNERQIFNQLLDEGLTPLCPEPGYIGDGDRVSNDDIKSALQKIGDDLFETYDTPSAILSRIYVESEKGNRYSLVNLYIGRQNVEDVYSSLKENKYPWPTVRLLVSPETWRWVEISRDKHVVDSAEPKPGMAIEEVAAPEEKPDWRNDPTLTKGEKQVRAISASIAVKGWNPMSVPDGEKGMLEMLCKADYPELFSADSAFNETWKRGLKKGKWRMQSHASYARRGVS